MLSGTTTVQPSPTRPKNTRPPTASQHRHYQPNTHGNCQDTSARTLPISTEIRGSWPTFLHGHAPIPCTHCLYPLPHSQTLPVPCLYPTPPFPDFPMPSKGPSWTSKEPKIFHLICTGSDRWCHRGKDPLGCWRENWEAWETADPLCACCLTAWQL